MDRDRGKLSGLVPLAVIGVIVTLFVRSCLDGFTLWGSSGGETDRSASAADSASDLLDRTADHGGSGDRRTGTTLGPDELWEMMKPVEPECPNEDGSSPRHLQWTEPPPVCIDPGKTYTATLQTDRGDIVVELDSENAPTSVNSFVFLARWHFYDGMVFHDVIPGVGAGTGDPVGRPPGTGGPGYEIEGELPTEEPYYPVYSVGMSIAGVPGVHKGDFFIVTGNGIQAPPNWPVVGQVIDGRAVVDEIDATGVRRAGTDRTPRERTLVESVTVEER